MSQSQSQPIPTASEQTKPQITPLRLVLLADQDSLTRFGPVLRRLAVGLMDEVVDLSLVCLEPSQALDFVPSPPIRLITKSEQFEKFVSKTAANIERRVKVQMSKFHLYDKFFPQQHYERLVDILTDYKPTIVHAMSEKQIKLARYLSQKLDIPYVASLLTQNKNPSCLHDKHCRGIFPYHSGTVRDIRQANPEILQQVQWIPIGCHVSEKSSCFNHQSNSAQVFCCTYLKHNRGISQLINAVKRILNKGHKIELTIAGKGSAEHDYRQQVKQLDISSHVNFIPPITDMISVSDAYKVVLKEADIFVQPWPQKKWHPQMLEAMSIGNAVVACEEQHNDLLIDNKTALTFPFQDEDALTACLEKLVTDKESAKTLAENGQKHLRKHFLVSQMISELVKCYQMAVNPNES